MWNKEVSVRIKERGEKWARYQPTYRLGVVIMISRRSNHWLTYKRPQLDLTYLPPKTGQFGSIENNVKLGQRANLGLLYWV